MYIGSGHIEIFMFSYGYLYVTMARDVHNVFEWFKNLAENVILCDSPFLIPIIKNVL